MSRPDRPTPRGPELSEELLQSIGLVSDGEGRWAADIPRRCNLSVDLVTALVMKGGGERIALTFEEADGSRHDFTFAELERQAARLAASFADLGVMRGDVVAVHTGQRPETVISHLAAYKLGAIVATASQLYGPDTMSHILADSGAKLLVTQDRVWSPLRASSSCFGQVRCCVVVGEARGEELTFADLVADGPGMFPAADTAAAEPALLIYTSGSSGMPKGILHGHRLLRGYRPSLELFYNLELHQSGLVFWTPADWAWIGGFVDVVFPSLHFGHRVVACQHRFEAEWSLDFTARHGVTHCLMTPTALRRLSLVDHPRRGRRLSLRTIFTGGEALASETYLWLDQKLGVVCNEGYGMSEVNQMIGNCKRLRPIKPGSMGWQLPGHMAALVDDEGVEVAPGEAGEIVTANDDPTLFLGYWRNPDLTAAMRLGPWVRTFDVAVMDEDGYYWYRGRKDDLIKSAGYRIGPAEIEDVMVQHPAVAEVGVIGVPDRDRGQLVRAYVRLAEGWEGSPALVEALQDHAKGRLAAYKYPREIVFVDDLPLTNTGKISRGALRRLAAESSPANSSA